MTTGASTRVLGGRILAGSSATIGAASIGALVVLGLWEFLLELGVIHLGILAIGLGTLTWLTIESEANNGAVWVLLWAGLLGALTAAGIAVLFAWGSTTFPGFNLEDFNALRPVDVPVPLTVAMQFAVWGWFPAFFLPTTLGLLLFPDGRLPSPKWRWVGWYTVVLMSVGIGLHIWLIRPSSAVPVLASDSTGLGPMVTLSEVASYLAMLGAPLSIAALTVRYRRSSGVARRQIRWIGLGSAFLTVAIVWTLIAETTPAAGATAAVVLAGESVLILSFGIAITKYRLYDIEVVISKTVTYASLAVVISGLYVGAVLGLIYVLGDSDKEFADLGVELFAATALVAIAFEPIRVRLQRVANRVAYGQRVPPHEVLSRFTTQLADSTEEEGLHGLAQLLRDGTGADKAAVWLRVGERLRVEAISPRDAELGPGILYSQDDLPNSDSDLSVPVRHGGELLGALGITKPRAHPVTPADEALLVDVAAGAGLLLRNLRLNAELAERAAELRASRRRLIAAHDAARHRLERDLHDGAQQQVVALKVRLGIAKALAEREGAPELAGRVEELAQGIQRAVDDMRRVARGIYPPLLEAEGLGPALTALRRSVDLELDVDVGGLPRFPKAVEETVYFCVLAVVSEAKMAGATMGHVEVRGDGVSLVASVRYDSSDGVGDLTGLLDRVDAFGGEVTASIEGGEATVALTLSTESAVVPA